MTEYAHDISIVRQIRNLSEPQVDDLDLAFYGNTGGLTQLMRNRVRFTADMFPSVTLVKPEEMLNLQEHLAVPFDIPVQNSLWRFLATTMPTPHFLPKTVHTWPEHIAVRGVNERQVWLGADESLQPERSFVTHALQSYLAAMFERDEAEIAGCWDENFVPGFYLATVSPINSELITKELIRVVHESPILEGELSLKGVQLATATRRL